MVWTCARRDSGHIGRRMLEMELPGFMDVVREDMQEAGVREQAEMENNDSLWRPQKRDKLNGTEEEGSSCFWLVC